MGLALVVATAFIIQVRSAAWSARLMDRYWLLEPVGEALEVFESEPA
jgi:hypothetical protein